MFKITLRISWSNIYTIYEDDNIEMDDAACFIKDPVLTKKDNSAGSLSFTAWKKPGVELTTKDGWFEQLKPMLPTLSVYKENVKKFEGRITSIEEGIYGSKKIYCEGALAYLNDSIQVPSEFKGTPIAFLTDLLNKHNARVHEDRKIWLGQVTVTDPNDYIHRYTNYENTLECINNKLVSSLGGHLVMRYDDANHKRYLDYLADFPGLSTQDIVLGENLLEYTNTWSIEELVTVLIPLGEMLEESPIDALYAYLTVSSVNNGSIYVQASDSVINTYGRVERTVSWDDVTEPANLLRKAKEYLESEQFENVVLDISAVDLHYINPDIDEFDVLDQVRVISPLCGMNKVFPVTQISIPLQMPEETEYTLGDPKEISYIGSVSNSTITIKDEIEKLPTSQSVLDEARKNATDIINAALADVGVNGYITVVDSGGTSQELLITNHPDYKKATKVWRWNINGFGYSSTGYNGPYTLAMTMDGSFVADFIKTGTMSADRIRGGTVAVGGSNNQNGQILVYNASGTQIGSWNNAGLSATGDLILSKVISGVTYTAKLGSVTYQDGIVTKTTGGLQLAKGTSTMSLVDRGLFSNGSELMIGTTKNTAGKWGEIQITPERMSFIMWQPYSNTYAGNGPWLGVNPFDTSKIGFFVDTVPTYLHGGNDAGVFIYVPSNTTGAGNAVLVRQSSNYYKLCQGTSSSKRYKDVVREMSDEDVEEYYNIQPVFAKFKDEILDEDDERYRLVHPMFIAENVDEHFPEAVDHNFDGEAENWNYRILIPAMFQMIKSQKKEIDILKEEVRLLKEMVLNGRDN